MKKFDARTLNREQLLILRQQVVELHQTGLSVKDIQTKTGLCRQAVDRTLKRHREGNTLMPGSRGNKKGAHQLINEEQQILIKKIIFKRRPGKAGFSNQNALWTQKLVTLLICRELDMDISQRVVNNYLHQWGLAIKQANKTPLQKCSPKFRCYLQEHLPALQERAQSSDVQLLWFLQPTLIRDIEEYRMLTVVDNRGTQYWWVIPGGFTEDRQIQFLKILLNQFRRKQIILIRHDPKHFSQRDVKDWVKQHAPNGFTQDDEINPCIELKAVKNRKSKSYSYDYDDLSESMGSDVLWLWSDNDF